MKFEFRYLQYAQALYDALRDDAFYITMEKSVADALTPKMAMLKYLEYSMREAQQYGELVLPNVQPYGVSIWSKPLSDKIETKKSAQKKSFIEQEMGSDSLKTYNEIVAFMSDKTDPLIDKEAFYLSIVGVLPQFQGQGLGPNLITNVLRETDRLNVATYLETFTARNMSFYQRLGYRDLGSFDEPTTKAKYWVMMREPNLIAI
jgi:ribosomal protein S18 acetylase RimI-like enzyme